MTSRVVKHAIWMGIAAAARNVTLLVPALNAQQSAMDAWQKARVLERLAEATPSSHRGTGPSFVLDPAWPKPLPHHWMIGDVGGIFVDRRDNIWVYHRPRS